MRTIIRFALPVAAALACGVGAPGATPRETVYAVVLFNRQYVAGASSMRSGLFYSTDDGDTWLHTGWKNVRAFGAAVDRHGAGGARRMFLAAGNGIHRTTDGGAFWKIVTDWHITEALRVAIDPFRDSTICAATAYGIFVSTDGGDTWAERNAGLHSTYTSALCADARVRRRLFTGTEEGMYVSADGAAHWRRCGGELFNGQAVLDIQQSSSAPNVFYAATEKRGIWRSTDGGATWMSASGDLPAAPWYSVAINPANPLEAAAAGFETGVWITTNGGAHWREASGGALKKKSFHALAFSRIHPGVLFAGEYDGGIWRSTDGGASWRFAGLKGSQVWQIVTMKSE